MMRRQPRTPITACLLAGTLLAGCSLYRLQAPEHPGVTDHDDVAWSFAWGLVPGVPEIDCQGRTLAEVTVKSNLFYDLVSLASLGLASPKRFEWKCAGATPATGSIPTGGAVPPSVADGGDAGGGSP